MGRLEAMKHEQFTSQKGNTLTANWTQDVGGQRQTFCAWEAGSEMTIQILDNDKNYEDLVYGSSSREYDTMEEATVAAEYLDLDEDEVKEFGWSVGEISVTARFSRWDTSHPPKCGNFWNDANYHTLFVHFLRASGPDKDRRLDSDGAARRLDSDWECKSSWTDQFGDRHTSTAIATENDNSPENFRTPLISRNSSFFLQILTWNVMMMMTLFGRVTMRVLGQRPLLKTTYIMVRIIQIQVCI